MESYGWNILSLGEVRWPGVGDIFTDEGHKVWYIGEERKKEKGVAFLVHKNTFSGKAMLYISVTHLRKLS